MIELTRGEYNNNPLNLNVILPPSTPYNGQLGVEKIRPGHSGTPRFGRYDTALNGIRAGAKQLIKDNQVYGLTTTKLLVEGKLNPKTGKKEFGWAPENDDNDDDSYIATVVEDTAARLGRPFTADTYLNLRQPQMLIAIWPAFCLVENGRCTYAPTLIRAACMSALGLS
jgi:hypothetical protein